MPFLILTQMQDGYKPLKVTIVRAFSIFQTHQSLLWRQILNINLIGLKLDIFKDGGMNKLNKQKKGSKNQQIGSKFNLPHVGWQLDPFGYSAVTPSLFSEYGIDTLFITRIGTKVKEDLKKQGHLQFKWRGHNPNQELFVQVYQGEVYTVTHQIPYDPQMKAKSCGFEDIAAENLMCLDYFVQDVVNNFMNTTDLHADKGDHVFHIPAFFGDDFTYTRGQETFYYIDKFANLLSKHSKERYFIQMDIKYSTIDEYLEDIAKVNTTYPIYQGDFLPYIEAMNCPVEECPLGIRFDYWSGYYSTKPVFKQQIRDLLNLQRNSEKLLMFSLFVQYLASEEMDQRGIIQILNRTREQTSILTHHDAITGTHTHHAKKDYSLRIDQATTLLKANNQDILQQLDILMKKYQGEHDNLFNLLNFLYDEKAKHGISDFQHIRVFNQELSGMSDLIVKFEAKESKYMVILDSNFNEMLAQQRVIKDWETKQVDIQRENELQVEVSMLIKDYNPLSILSFIMITFNSIEECRSFLNSDFMTNEGQFKRDERYCYSYYESSYQTSIDEDGILIENKDHKIHINAQGMIDKLTQGELEIAVSQNYMRYDGKDTNSGLYLFNPYSKAELIEGLRLVKVIKDDGPLFQCLKIFHQSDKQGDILFSNDICLDKYGDSQDLIHQNLRAYTSTYNELVLRQQIIEINGKQAVNLDFYTDDSIKQIKRKVYTLQEAIQIGISMASGQDEFVGYNGYPCNNGLVINGMSAGVSIGMSLSHPVTCHLIDSNTFEMILTRSLGNNDIKGISSLRNTDITLSDLKINLNIDKVNDYKTSIDFINTYNLGKALIKDQPLIFTHEVDNKWNKEVYMDYQIFKNSIIEDRDVQLKKVHYDEEKKQIYLYIKNTLPQQIEIESENFKPLEHGKIKLSQLGHLKPLISQFQNVFIGDDRQILQDIKPRYETYDQIYPNFEKKNICESSTQICLEPNEIAVIWVQMQFTEEEQAQISNDLSQIDREEEIRRLQKEQAQQNLQQQQPSLDETQNNKKRQRRKYNKREMPVEGDSRTHLCFKLHIIALLILAQMGTAAFLFYASCAANKKKSKSSNHSH
ncbi:lysosomal alpha- [Stylonychia lemnae]|uniref:Lysosomal alpha n=1 Tax=Stylonychia lemnae TaxID=5949 RepID=A0A078ARC3_STYLE|nr:lysosomal alpha- [Stylonychia lemnae]|eukprot:CDW83393.1 lysosomal alpha- [Stylonychia lemnae]